MSESLNLGVTDAARFWAKVRRGDGCWEWTGAKTRGGYGQFAGCFGQDDWRPRRAHRVAWEIANGPPPVGLLVCHRCDNRLCVNPVHLFLGTSQDNTDDMLTKGRHRVSRALTEHQVVDVVTLRALGASVDDLAASFGVHRMTIYRTLERSA